jgi:integrase
MPDELMSIVLAGLNPGLSRQYMSHYRDYAKYSGASSPWAALRELIGKEYEEADGMLSCYREHINKQLRSEAHISNRIGSLRRAVRKLREAGLTALDLDFKPPSKLQIEGLLVSEVIAGLAESSKTVYRNIYNDLGRFLGSSAEEALGKVFGLSDERARAILDDYLANLMIRSFSSSTINVYVCAINSAINQARSKGLTTLSLNISYKRIRTPSSQAKPGIDDWRRLLDRAEAEAKIGVVLDADSINHAVRNLAIILLVYELFLRSVEVEALDLSDVDLMTSTLRVRGVRLEIPSSVRDALSRWVEARGDRPGPLFMGEDCCGNEIPRLGRRSISDFLETLSRRAGLKEKVGAEGLRQSGIARAIELGRDPEEIQAICRFARIEQIWQRSPGNGLFRKRRVSPPRVRQKSSADLHETVIGESRHDAPYCFIPGVPQGHTAKPGVAHDPPPNTCSVVLDGPGRPALVYGKRTPLSRKRFRLIEPLVIAGPAGLSGPELRVRSGCPGYRRMLDRMLEDAVWKVAIVLPGSGNTREHYRIIWTVGNPST